MSWLSRLAETYDNVSGMVGIQDEKGNCLIALNCMRAKSHLNVVLSESGEFQSVTQSVLTIQIPCTEKSAGRSGNDAPHPLHEKLKYLGLDEGLQVSYLGLLDAWRGDSPKLEAVRNYIAGNTIISDLSNSGIKVAVDSFSKDGTPKSAKVIKSEEDEIASMLVRFSVNVQGDCEPDLWKDKLITELWRGYCDSEQSGKPDLCYATGIEDIPLYKHPKGVNNATYGAKFISSKIDGTSDFTFRGRFLTAEQAYSVSGIVSQKAHLMLGYLIATQGYKADTQAIVAWAIDDGTQLPNAFASSEELYSEDGDDTDTDTDTLVKAQGALGRNYALGLRDALLSMGSTKVLRNTSRRVAVLGEDAASTGRAAITFYQEFSVGEYLECLENWHMSCSWWFGFGSRRYVSAPSELSIVYAVYGKPKSDNDIGFQKIRKNVRERLLSCIFNGEGLSYGWVRAAVSRVSNPFSYTDKDNHWDMSAWERAISVVCALLRKFYSQNKEEYSLELNEQSTNRSYLFGRLLAIADRLESHERFLRTGKDETGKSATNAVRYMTAFVAKPVRTWSILFSQLNPYIQKLGGAEGYQQQIDEIMLLLRDTEGFTDTPLDGTYLLGYSLQRLEYTKKNKGDK